MKALLFILGLSLFFGCGKTWRSNAKKEADPSKRPTASSQDQWSGRSDYIDTRWQVKSQP
jgi:hypothetical protein